MRLFTHSMLAKTTLWNITSSNSISFIILQFMRCFNLWYANEYLFFALHKIVNIIKIIYLPICIGIFKIRYNYHKASNTKNNVSFHFSHLHLQTLKQFVLWSSELIKTTLNFVIVYRKTVQNILFFSSWKLS